MEVINYFKIKSLVEVCISNQLKEIFKERYRIEMSGQEWKNNEAHGNFILENYPGINGDGRNLVISLDDQSTIQKGIIGNYPFKVLFKLLNEFKFQRVNKESLRHQSKILCQINHIYLKNIIDNKELKINDQQFIELKNQLIKLMNHLDSSNNNNSSSSYSKDNNSNNNYSIDNNKIYKQVTYILDTLQDNNSGDNQYYINKDNEIKANEFKQTGNTLYSQSKYAYAIDSYRAGLELLDISNFTKSLLLLNSSTTRQIEHSVFSRQSSPNHIIMEDNDYLMIKQARSYSIDAIVNRPSWSKPYYKLGVILSILSRYQLSIEMFKASLVLDNSRANNDLINPLIQQSLSKLNIINQCLDSNGDRDYEKETSTILYQVLDFNNYILGNYKKKLDHQFTTKLFKKIPKYYHRLIAFGVPERRAIDLNIQAEVYQNVNLIKDGKASKLTKEECDEAFERLIGNNTEVAFTWQELKFKRLEKQYLNQDDFKFILAITMKTSLSPYPLAKPNWKNDPLKLNHYITSYDVVANWEYLARIYRFGTCGEDVDIKKSKYYFNKVIEANKIFIKEYRDLLDDCKVRTYCYLGMAGLYLQNSIKDFKSNLSEYQYTVSKENTKLAIQLWKLGKDVPERTTFVQLCDQKYIKYLLNNPDGNDSKFEQPTVRPSIDISKDIKKNRGIIHEIIQEFNADQDHCFNRTIDFSLVKKSASEGSIYSKSLFQVFLDTASFIQSFQSYLNQQQQQQQPSIQERINLITPLAQLYCKVEFIHYIRIPSTVYIQLTQFIDQLNNQVKDNKIVSVCYLGINIQYRRYSFMEEAIRLSPSPDNGGIIADEYDEYFGYVLCWLLIQCGNVRLALENLIKFDIVYNSSSYHFNLLAVYILYYVGPQSFIQIGLLPVLLSKGLNFVNALPKDHEDSLYYRSLLAYLMLTIRSNKVFNDIYPNLKSQFISVMAGLDIESKLPYLKENRPKHCKIIKSTLPIFNLIINDNSSGSSSNSSSNSSGSSSNSSSRSSKYNNSYSRIRKQNK